MKAAKVINLIEDPEETFVTTRKFLRLMAMDTWLHREIEANPEKV